MWVVFDCPLTDEDPSCSNVSYHIAGDLRGAADRLANEIATSIHFEADPELDGDTPPVSPEIQAEIDSWVANPNRPDMLRYDTPEWSHVLMRIVPVGDGAGWVKS